MIWAGFFRPGTSVVAVPTRDRARLFIALGSVRWRWNVSRLYPAHRLTARIAKLLLRVKATLAFGSFYVADSDWLLEPLLKAAGMESLMPSAVLLGTRGPAQKVVIELRSSNGDVAAFVKYGETQAAQRRLGNEHTLLRLLPDGQAPQSLGYGPVGAGVGLILTPVDGKALPARASLPANVLRYVASLPVAGVSNVDAHPWIVQLREFDEESSRKWIDVLSSRDWPVLPQHGDFAPWNLLQDHARRVRAIDWEYGTWEGFPGTDLAYYLLQVSALIHRWPSDKARSHAVRILTELDWPGLDSREAEALVRLTSMDAYRIALEDGHAPTEPLQAWRRAVWEGN